MTERRPVLIGLVCVMLLPCAATIAGDTTRVLGLHETEAIAQRNSFDIRAARMEQHISHQSTQARLRDFFPSLSISYRRNRQVAERNFDNGSHSVQLSMSQPVFDGGRTKLAYDVARIDESLAREKIRELRNSTRLQAREAYLSLLQSRERLRISEESLKNIVRLLNRSRLEYKQGQISVLDLQEAENQFAVREMDVVTERLALDDGLVDLQVMLRLPDDIKIQIRLLDLYSFNIGEIKRESDELYQMALQNRSDVRQARIALMRSRREYLITKYDYLPTVSLTGNYGKTGEDWPPRETEWGVGVNFTFRMFGNTINTDINENRSHNETSRGYSTSGQLSVYDNASWREPHMRNELALLKARTQNRDLIEQVRRQVDRIRRDYSNRKRQLELADSALNIKARRFDIQQRELYQGELSTSDYIEAELEMVQARLDMVRQRVEFILQAGKIELELGMDLDALQLVQIKELDENEPLINKIKKTEYFREEAP